MHCVVAVYVLIFKGLIRGDLGTKMWILYTNIIYEGKFKLPTLLMCKKINI